ncbi:dTDP-4-dehydrorhamnose 3,5-epimerase, partial [Candidatus Margulisiibacteriota bacterium]
MKFEKLAIPEVIYIEPKIWPDGRGYFFEAYHQKKFYENGIAVNFVQDNQSRSAQGTLRGLHFQVAPFEQGKLVRVLDGEIFDVAVDIRPGSPNYGKWVAKTLSSEKKDMLYVPPGFAHGFYV